MLGKRVLDHAESIRICCDKVNMYARLQRNGVPLPETRFLGQDEVAAATADALFEALGAPLVLKAPNSSFSAYVDKVATPGDFVRVGKRFLRRADRIVVQQYMPSDFDWRVITLDGRVLAVLKYRFAPHQWKLMDRTEEGEWARVEGVAREDADARLLEVGVAAANAVGRSLYGVDIKEIDGAYTVIEVNDNPTIAAGEEDQANPEIYDEIIRYLAGGD
jgi:glutathione synthase/RimK-type ligase-like ATP-grasp enzyme